MSDGSSLFADSTVSHETGATDTTQSHVSGTNVPLVLASAYEEQKLKQVRTLPQLPSHRYRYTVWHELSREVLPGDQLHAPRIREGPPEKDEMFYRIKDEKTGQFIHHSRTGAERKDYRDTTENWENTLVANLSYQDLQHAYQKENFMRVLHRLFRVEQLTLQENRLENLSSIYFPRCTHLTLSRNFLAHFKSLPKIPAIQYLNLFGNNIKTFSGLETLKTTPIQSLVLKGNPCAFMLNYRQRVFNILPQLQYLDEVPRQPEDEEFAAWENPENSSSCAIL